MDAPLLSLHALDPRYISGVPVVRPVALNLAAGGALFLRGRNGSGKTTVLLGVVGALPFVGGSVRLRGVPLDGPPAARTGRDQIGIVQRRAPVCAQLTGNEHLELAASIGGGGFGDLLDNELFEPLRVGEVLCRRAGTYSGGEQRLLSLAAAALRRPAVILLDEPMAGLRDSLRPALQGWLERIRSEGVALVLIEHESFELEGSQEIQLEAADLDNE